MENNILYLTPKKKNLLNKMRGPVSFLPGALFISLSFNALLLALLICSKI